MSTWFSADWAATRNRCRCNWLSFRGILHSVIFCNLQFKIPLFFLLLYNFFYPLFYISSLYISFSICCPTIRMENTRFVVVVRPPKDHGLYNFKFDVFWVNKILLARRKTFFIGRGFLHLEQTFFNEKIR